MIAIGIDPGKSGAIAVVYGTKTTCLPIAYTPDNVVDVAWLQDHLILVAAGYALIERQQARARQAGQFAIAENYGRITATLDLCGVQWDEVSPQKWQNYHGVTGDKSEHVAKAHELGFDVPYTSYKQDGTPRANASRWHDAADAYLIAKYAEYCGKIYWED